MKDALAGKCGQERETASHMADILMRSLSRIASPLGAGVEIIVWPRGRRQETVSVCFQPHKKSKPLSSSPGLLPVIDFVLNSENGRQGVCMRGFVHTCSCAGEVSAPVLHPRNRVGPSCSPAPRLDNAKRR